MSTESEAGRTWSSKPSSSDRESQLDPGSRSPSAGPRECNYTGSIVSMDSSPGVDERQTLDLQLWTRATPHSSETEADPEKTRQYIYHRRQAITSSQIEKIALEDSSGSRQPDQIRRSATQPITTDNIHSNPVALQKAPRAEEIFPNIYMMEESRAFYGDGIPPFALANKFSKAGFHYHAGGPDDPGGLGYRFVDLEMQNLQFLFGSLVTSPISKIFWTPWNEHYNCHVMHLGSISVIIRGRGSKLTPWMGPHKQFDHLCVGHGFRKRGNSTLFKHQLKDQGIPKPAPRGSGKGDAIVQLQHGDPDTPASSLNVGSKRRRTLAEDDTENEEEDEYKPNRPRRATRAPRPPQSSKHSKGGTLVSFSSPRRKSGRRRYNMTKRWASAAQKKADNVIRKTAGHASAQTTHAPINTPPPQVPAANDLAAGLSNQKLSRTRLHISLTTNNYGSVPVYLKTCQTVESFFDTCFDAWGLHDKVTKIGAITATLSWLPKNDQTMVVMRKIPDSYHYLLDAIDKAPCWEGGGESATCDVRVKVIMESGPGA